MRYTSFTIEQYKGIKKLVLDLNIQPDYKVYTLVGLNESGKTTILEAINDFENPVLKSQRHLLIPKNLAGGFTGSSEIKATLAIDDSDKVKIEEFIRKKTKAKHIIIDDNLTVTRQYLFENSEPGDTKLTYSTFVQIKKLRNLKILL